MYKYAKKANDLGRRILKMLYKRKKRRKMQKKKKVSPCVCYTLYAERIYVMEKASSKMTVKIRISTEIRNLLI